VTRRNRKIRRTRRNRKSRIVRG